MNGCRCMGKGVDEFIEKLTVTSAPKPLLLSVDPCNNLGVFKQPLTGALWVATIYLLLPRPEVRT